MIVPLTQALVHFEEVPRWRAYGWKLVRSYFMQAVMEWPHRQLPPMIPPEKKASAA
jgi:hypothetical protein